MREDQDSNKIPSASGINGFRSAQKIGFLLGLSIIIFGIISFNFILFSGCNEGPGEEDLTPTPTPWQGTTGTPSPSPSPSATPYYEYGILSVMATDQEGAIVWAPIYVDDIFVGYGYRIGTVPIGTYTISFGPLDGYATPAEQVIAVVGGQQTDVVGIYIINSSILNVMVAGIVPPTSIPQGMNIPIEWDLDNAESWEIESSLNPVSPASGFGSGHVYVTYDCNNVGIDSVTITAKGGGGTYTSTFNVIVNVPVLIDDLLNSSTVGSQNGAGQFALNGGWYSEGGRIEYDLGSTISRGFIELKMRGWVPPAGFALKSHPISGYEVPGSYSHHTAPGSFFNWRIGLGYHPFKALAAPQGASTREEERIGNDEDVTIDKHIYRVEWDNGAVKFIFDGEVLHTFTFYRFHIRALVIGTCHDYPATVPPPIISEVRIGSL
ncbi:hypothetical protein ACFL27_06125 [candidate division CSSED10-310 bacterium]|uniref:GH16 domain-containing protein n=1 Tax=candidate division CSSED10-310 bacterium TaxID=2855610 RepID=A0ABV6YUB0_UNCC1